MESEDGGALLPELLQMLNGGGLLTVAEVAYRLNISEPLVMAMADGLAQRGYLATLGGECSTAPAVDPCPLPPAHACWH